MTPEVLDMKHLQSNLGHQVQSFIEAWDVAAGKHMLPDEIVRFPLLLVTDEVEDADPSVS